MKIINAYVLYARTDMLVKEVLQSEGLVSGLIGIVSSVPEIIICKLFK
jgi:hypothetical protein